MNDIGAERIRSDRCLMTDSSRNDFKNSCKSSADQEEMSTRLLEADLSVGKGVLWLKSPQPSSKDGTLFVARYMGQGKAGFEPGADLFVHLVYGPCGDRSCAIQLRFACIDPCEEMPPSCPAAHVPDALACVNRVLFASQEAS